MVDLRSVRVRGSTIALPCVVSFLPVLAYEGDDLMIARRYTRMQRPKFGPLEDWGGRVHA